MEDTWLQSRWDLFRNIVHDIVDNPFFEWTILLLIFASRYLLMLPGGRNLISVTY
jgi:hypothetical protein